MSTDSQPGIGGGHIYIFAGMDKAGSGKNFKFIDADYGCGYALYALTIDGTWSWLTNIDFVKEEEETLQIRPYYPCKVDQDCASVVPDADFDYVFCDYDADPSQGICHFNNDGRGVQVDRHGECPFGCQKVASDCNVPKKGSSATCCAKDYSDFGGDRGCWYYGCTPEGACTSGDPRCYGSFAKKNAFCNRSLESYLKMLDN